jgi:hypothetical protein
MIRLPVIAVLLLAMCARPAGAKVDPHFSHVDPVVLGDAAGSYAYRVEFRDVSNAPQIHELAILDFSQTTVRLSPVQEAGVTVDCAARTLSRLTDGTGVAIFHPRFGGSCNSGSVVVNFRDTWSIAWVPARSTDLDALDGCTGLGDLILFAQPFLGGDAGHAEMDFDGSGGAPGLGDFVMLSKDLLGGIKMEYCP